MSRELLQQALDALNADHHFGDYRNLCAALRAALAQPEPAPAVPLTPTEARVMDIARECDAVVYTNRHFKETPAASFSYSALQAFARAVIAESAAPAVREPKPAELLGMAVVDAIVDDGMRNAAGGIYATRVQEFAREVQIAFAQQNRVDLSGIGGGGK